jgi:hypothetical protein
MIPMRGAARIVLIIVAVGLSGAAFVNVFDDDTALRKDAEAVACPRGCPKATSIAYDRTPFAETVSYEVPEGTIRVKCARAAILFGPYACVKE